MLFIRFHFKLTKCIHLDGKFYSYTILAIFGSSGPFRVVIVFSSATGQAFSLIAQCEMAVTFIKCKLCTLQNVTIEVCWIIVFVRICKNFFKTSLRYLETTNIIERWY